MKKLRKRLLLGSVFLLAAVLLAAGIEKWRGARALDSRLLELKAKSEKLTVAELKPAPVADADNAALALLSLSSRLSAVMTNVGELPPIGRVAAPGKLILATRLDFWVDEKVTNTWEHVQAGLATDSGLANDFHAAMSRPGFNLNYEYERGFIDVPLPPLTTVKQFAQWQAISAVAQLQAGRTAGALASLTDGAHFLERLNSEPLIISQLVGVACGAILWNATWAALQSPGLDEIQLARLQAAWHRLDFSTAMLSACEMERAMTLTEFERLRNSSAARDRWVNAASEMAEFMGNDAWSPPTRGFLLHHVHLPLWRAIWIEQDAAHAVELWQPILDACRLTRDQSWLAYARTVPGFKDEDASLMFLRAMFARSELGFFDRCRFLVSGQPMSVDQSLALKAAKLDTQCGMIVAAIAVERFRLRKGERPENLELLVPDFLDRVPKDYLDGKPLKYRRNADGSFVLYSVGENGKDDGGNLAPAADKNSFTQIWQGLDAVWPAPATAEETTAALKAKR